MAHIDTATLAAWQADGRAFILLDVLPPQVFADAHLPGAINIISDDVLALAPHLLPDRAATIVVYCGSVDCKRAGLAAARLETLGYSGIYHYTGGKRDWRAAGLAMAGRKGIVSGKPFSSV